MATFLGLPRELRDKILALVLSHHLEAPTDVSDPSGRASFDDIPDSWENPDILYTDSPDQTMRDSTTLLLLNQQLHKETQEAIQRLPTKSYILDVIIANEEKLWATWLYAPVLSKRVDRVYAAIRTIGYRKENSHSLFRAGCGGPPAITMLFFSLIKRGVKVGPVERQATKFDQKISLRELVIDVRTPDVPSSKLLPRRVSPSYSGRHRFHQANGREFLIHPEYITNYIISDIEMILEMSRYSAEYGALVYERIGNIKVLMDGEERKEWNLATGLADVKFNDSFSSVPRAERKKAFALWKLEAHRTRTELGLPVVPLPEETAAAGKNSSR